jgi:transcriptional regulator with XRE-family HTH domain
MSISQRLLTLRQEHNLTQQEVADRVGLHVNQIRRYESENDKRGPDDGLRLQCEAVSRMPPEDKRIVKALLDGMIIKFQTKQLIGGLSS